MNRKKLGIAFGIGILLCGLGCGIAFAQYSDFEYAGERKIGEETLKTETVERDIEADSKIFIGHPDYGCDITLVADESVPIDKIDFDVTYNCCSFAVLSVKWLHTDSIPESIVAVRSQEMRT